MFSILSHRGNIYGPNRDTENRLPSVEAALQRGWGLETDIRRAPDGTFYIAHDQTDDCEGLDATQFCGLFRAHPDAVIALNVKELGDEAALVAFLGAQGVDRQVFLFDMELIEPVAGQTAALLRSLHPTLLLAARVSDRGEPVDRALAMEAAVVIWLDEFDGPWATAGDIRRLKDAGRTVHAVSPELHGASVDAARDRWTFFCKAGVDGICTDYPDELDRHVRRELPGITT